MQRAASKNTWDRVLGKIESKVSSHSFSTWFKPTRFLSEDDSSVRVSVPNNWFAEWLRTNYSTLIQDALRAMERPGLSVDFLPATLEIRRESAARDDRSGLRSAAKTAGRSRRFAARTEAARWPSSSGWSRSTSIPAKLLSSGGARA